MKTEAKCLWNALNMVLNSRFIATIAYLKKKKKETNLSIFPLLHKELGNKEQTGFKISQKKQ